MNWMGGVKRRAQKRKESTESKQRKYFEQRRKTRNLGSMQNDFAFEESVAGKGATAFDETAFPFRPELSGAVPHSTMEELYHPIKDNNSCTASLDILSLSKNSGASCGIPLASLPRTQKNSSQQHKVKEKNGWNFSSPAPSTERTKKTDTIKELDSFSQEPIDDCPHVVLDKHGDTCLTNEKSNAQLHQTIQNLSHVISQQQEMITSLQQQLSEASHKHQNPVSRSGRSSLTPEVTRSGGDELASSADESPPSAIVSGYKVSKAPVTINICAGTLSMMNGNGSMNIMGQGEKRASCFAASQPEFRMHRRDFELDQEAQAHALVLPQGTVEVD